MKNILPVIVLMAVSTQASAEVLPGMGPWRLGMTASQVAAFDELGPYSKVGVTGGLETPNGTFNGHKTNTSFVFGEKGLSYIQIWNYEGQDWEKAREAALEVYDYFAEHYGGATVNEVTINGKHDLDRDSMKVLLERVLGSARELNENSKKEHQVIMTITFDMVPLWQPKESRLHCTWVYAGRYDTFFVFLFQDPSDQPRPFATSTIQLDPL